MACPKQMTEEGNEQKSPCSMKVEKMHHVAYRCRCAKETVAWYKEHLNMNLLVCISEDRCPSTQDPDPYAHIFLEAGPNILAFFELPNSPAMEVPICGANTPAWVQHIAFQVADMPTLKCWKAELVGKGLDVVGPTHHGIICSIYFFDPNGHRLELTCCTDKPGQMEELAKIAPTMIDEFYRTKKVVRHANWLHKNPCGLLGVAFATFADPEPGSPLFPNIFGAFGFSRTGKHRALDVDIWKQGDINLLVDRETTFSANFARAHGPCLYAMGWLFEDSAEAFRTAVARGARPYEGVSAFDGVPAIYGIGNSLIYFMEPSGERSLSAFVKPHDDLLLITSKGFKNIDHFTNNVHQGTLHKTADFYMHVFGFEEYRWFNIRGEKTGLKSYALKSPSGNFCIPINEGTEVKSQIAQYLDEYRGEGVQHLAFSTEDIVGSMEAMQGCGVEFLDIDDEYYDGIFDKVTNCTEDHAKIKELQILVDNDMNDEGGYLLQIFTREIIGPIFIELIQRKNHSGFGEGNFGALFRSMEKEQERRGLLD